MSLKIETSQYLKGQSNRKREESQSRTSKYMRGKWMEFKGEVCNSTIILGDANMPFIAIY